MTKQNKSPNNRLAQFFKKVRKEMRITQKEFSEMTGTNLKVIRSIEQGHSTIHLYKLEELMKFLGYELIPVERKRLGEVDRLLTLS